MSGETADHEPVNLANLAEWLHNSGLSNKDQQAVQTAVVDSMIEGATPDRAFVQRLIELAAGRITIDEYTSQVLKAADADYAAGNTISGEELRTRYGLTSKTPPRRQFGQLPDLVIPDKFDDQLPDLENPVPEGNSAT
ncbi:antitoxin VbhA family protein [Mycolicibacterium fortuitum]|uniref:antitoxin VbhA family protein n=1 Tax=Mycolicibacterium fortuitum TaxID=1766 RepID=UPI001C0F89F2